MPKGTPRPNHTFRAARRNRCKDDRGVWPGIRPKFRLAEPNDGKRYPYNSKKRTLDAEKSI